MAGELRFTPTEEDFVAARRDTVWIAWRSGRVRLTWATVPAVFVLLGVAEGWPDPVGVAGSAFDFGLIGTAVAVATAWAIWGLVGPQSRRIFRRSQLLRQEVRYGWTEHGLELASARGHADLPWPMLYAWARAQRNVLLYTSSATCQYMPLRLLDGAQAADLEAILTRSGLRRL